MDKKNKMSKKFLILLFVFCFVLIILVAVGFGVFSGRKKDVMYEEENGGDVVLNYTSNIPGLKLTNMSPVVDNIAMKNVDSLEYFDFSVDVSLDNATSIDYELAVLKDEKFSTISDDDIRIYLEQEQSGSYVGVFGPEKYSALKEKTELSSPAKSMVLFQTKKTKSLTDHYRLRIWLSNESLIPNGNYAVEVLINGKSK